MEVVFDSLIYWHVDDRWTLVRVRVRTSSLVRWFPLLQSVCDITWSHSRVTAFAWQLSRFIVCDTRTFCGRHELAQIHWAWPLPRPHPW